MTTKPKFFTDSRSSTPDPTDAGANFQSATATSIGDYDEKSDFGEAQNVQDGDADVVPRGVGLLPEEVYSRTLSSWRAGIRKRIVKNVEWESQVIARMQVRCFV